MRNIASFLPLFLVILQTTYTVTLGQVDVSDLPEVTVYASVADEDGNPAEGLKQEDFKLTEDGKTVKITNFAGIGDERPADIVFVFDTTGSMEQEINGVIDTCVRFAEKLEESGRDYRLGLVTFGDNIRGVYASDRSLTNNVQVFKDWMKTLKAEGGDDDPENPFGALKEATKMKFREKSQVIFLLITDAPAHHTGDPPQPTGGFDDPDLTYDRTLELLSDPRMIAVYSITIDDLELHKLAEETGGRFYDIQKNPDFTGIIEDIGTVIASQYRISYITPRPDFDGTRRNIRLEVKGSSATKEYLEPHLINIKSNLLVGVVFLTLLVLALVAPALGMMLIKRKAQPVEAGQVMPSPTQVKAPMTTLPPPVIPQPIVTQPPQGGQSFPAYATCPTCGKPVRPGARFCASCGRILAEPPPPVRQAAPPVQPLVCAQCGAPLRPEAKFCGKCGARRVA